MQRGDDDVERALRAFKPARWMSVANAWGAGAAFGAYVAWAAWSVQTLSTHRRVVADWQVVLVAVASFASLGVALLLLARASGDTRSELRRTTLFISVGPAYAAALFEIVVLRFGLAGWPPVRTLPDFVSCVPIYFIVWLFVTLPFSAPRVRADRRVADARCLADREEVGLALLHAIYAAPPILLSVAGHWWSGVVVSFALAAIAVAVVVVAAADSRRRRRRLLVASAGDASALRIVREKGGRRLVRVGVVDGFRADATEEVVCLLDGNDEPIAIASK